jgi:hypothetical protein
VRAIRRNGPLLEEAAEILATRRVGEDRSGQHDAVDARCKRRRHLDCDHGPGMVADDGRPFDAQRVEDVDRGVWCSNSRGVPVPSPATTQWTCPIDEPHRTRFKGPTRSARTSRAAP